ncbi:MAG: hypothetical protein Q8S13_04395, partial [Dehalococcoidia bacterium]|nr:hypothetical protein [Dehalococcoidia bacterium]
VRTAVVSAEDDDGRPSNLSPLRGRSTIVVAVGSVAASVLKAAGQPASTISSPSEVAALYNGDRARAYEAFRFAFIVAEPARSKVLTARPELL